MHLTIADSGLLVLAGGINVFWPVWFAVLFSLRAANEPTVCLDADETRRGDY